MLTYLLLSAQVFAPILVTLYFRKFLQDHPEATTEAVEGAYTRVNLWMIGGLLLSILIPRTDLSSTLSMANFALTLMAFLWVQFDYSRALEIRRARHLETPAETTPPGDFLVQALRGFVCLFCFYVLFYFLNVFAIVVLFYSTPVLVRLMFSTLPMAPSPLRDRIESAFREAGVNLGQIRIIQSKRKNFSNAMVCGTRFGVGPFKRTLLITEALFSRLDEEEFLAVMRHEAAHFKLNHLRDRFLSVIGTYLASIVMVVIPAFALTAFLLKMHWYLPEVQAVLSLIATIGALYWMNHVTFSIIHRHEHEADVESVKMGSRSETMISALQKITADHGGANARRKSFVRRLMLNHAHPSLEERIEVIRTGVVPKNPLFSVHPVKLAAAYTLMLVSAVYFYTTTPDKTPNREIASEPEHPANISH